jgi:L-serine dehydratase
VKTIDSCGHADGVVAAVAASERPCEQKQSPISVFDIIKIGIGPSSSHTMGPWEAARLFVQELASGGVLAEVTRVRVTLYGSLALTGIGHGSDVAVMLGLSGEDYRLIDVATIAPRVLQIKTLGLLQLGGRSNIGFSYEHDLVLKRGELLDEHPNGMVLEAWSGRRFVHSLRCFSVGGGFIQRPDSPCPEMVRSPAPYSCPDARSIEMHCREQQVSLAQLVRRNERAWRADEEITRGLRDIWEEIIRCVHRGVSRGGILPGGLGVTRRAKTLHDSLSGAPAALTTADWLHQLVRTPVGFSRVNLWVSCFALAVSEENAAFGRVVTAPTNGAAGVVPAVLMYGHCFEGFDERQIGDFLLASGEIGSLFKRNATISAAMGGCQAEIGVSAAMAAAGLVEARGGRPEQVLMAAEIAMEHHLGLTCDPVGGLVQIPCIERNTMGAIKAITAANLAWQSDPAAAVVGLDDVVTSMWRTAQDMNRKYKETSQGGLAASITVDAPEC